MRRMLALCALIAQCCCCCRAPRIPVVVEVKDVDIVKVLWALLGCVVVAAKEDERLFEEDHAVACACVAGRRWACRNVARIGPRFLSQGGREERRGASASKKEDGSVYQSPTDTAALVEVTLLLPPGARPSTHRFAPGARWPP